MTLADFWAGVAFAVPPLLVLPPIVRALSDRFDDWWDSRPIPACRRPWWNSLTPDGVAWALVFATPVVLLGLAFGWPA